MSDAQTNQRLAEIDKEIKAVERKNELGQLSDEEATERIKQFELTQKEIRRTQAEDDKALALLQATINTAVAVTRFLSMGDTAQAIVAGILGALEIAAISAEPIPEFRYGTKEAPGGMALVGEAGKERVFLPKGSKVIPNDPTTKYARHLDAMVDGTYPEFLRRDLQFGFSTYDVPVSKNYAIPEPVMENGQLVWKVGGAKPQPHVQSGLYGDDDNRHRIMSKNIKGVTSQSRENTDRIVEAIGKQERDSLKRAKRLN